MPLWCVTTTHAVSESARCSVSISFAFCDRCTARLRPYEPSSPALQTEADGSVARGSQSKNALPPRFTCPRSRAALARLTPVYCRRLPEEALDRRCRYRQSRTGPERSPGGSTGLPLRRPPPLPLG